MISIDTLHHKITRDKQRQFEREAAGKFVYGRVPDGTRAPRSRDSRQQRRREDLLAEKASLAAERHRRRVNGAVVRDIKRREGADNGNVSISKVSER